MPTKKAEKLASYYEIFGRGDLKKPELRALSPLFSFQAPTDTVVNDDQKNEICLHHCSQHCLKFHHFCPCLYSNGYLQIFPCHLCHMSQHWICMILLLKMMSPRGLQLWMTTSALAMMMVQQEA
jgi:hypothetical protein